MATVMVIEDSLIYRELLRELCESEGHTVIECSRAEDALMMLRNHKGADIYNLMHRIDLFVVDFNMDQMNGFEMVRKFRAMERIRQVPVLMISATDKNMSDLLKLEGIAFLPKPSPNVAVLSVIRSLLGKARTHPLETIPHIEKTPASPAPTVPTDAPALRKAFEAFSRTNSASLPTLPPLLPTPAMPSTPSVPPAEVSIRASVELPSVTPESHRVSLGVIEDGIKTQISNSATLSEYLLGRQKLSGDAGRDAEAPNSPIADLLDKILDSALRLRASDIHIEPQAGALDIRLRVDGVLQPLVRLPLSVAESLVARVKIMCALNITEKRLPQDGQFVRRGSEGLTAKLRVSTLPSVHGEKVVLRVLQSESLRVNLEGVGFSVRDLMLIRKVLRSSNGMVLVTGPTGSGKTTTLYTMLESLNSGSRNIVTVEDPVEYQLSGITQVQVNPAIGYTFERVLRSFLRQDPDVMLVGEIRDAETGEIALKAAVTGHFVLSTLSAYPLGSPGYH